MNQHKSSEKPKVSVLTTVYNGFPYLPETVDGVLNQTFRDFEYVIVNDGSDDETCQYLESLSDPRVRVIMLPRSGRGIALNKGLEDCISDLVAIIDADDIDSPIRLEVQQKLMNENSDLAVLSCRAAIDIGELYVGPYRDFPIVHVNFKDFIKRTPISHSGAIIRRVVLLDVGGYNEKRKDLFDYDLWLRLAEKGFSFGRAHGYLVYKRIHAGQNFEVRHRIRYLWSGFKGRMRAIRLFSKNPFDLFYPFACFMFGLLPINIRRKYSVKVKLEEINN